MTAPGDLETALRENYAAQRDSMLAGDAGTLGQLLAEDFTLTHMTGYEQSRAEWLAQVASGEMTYHRIRDVAVTVRANAFGPVLTARTRTDAAIWGGRGTWPLQVGPGDRGGPRALRRRRS